MLHRTCRGERHASPSLLVLSVLLKCKRGAEEVEQQGKGSETTTTSGWKLAELFRLNVYVSPKSHVETPTPNALVLVSGAFACN